MKKIFFSILLVTFFVSSLYAETATSTLNVKGMFCAGCSTKIEKTLNSVPGVQSVKVDFDQGKAAVTYDKSKVQPEKLAEKVTDIGFETTVSR